MKKAVISGTTFLWKKNEMNAVLEKIEAQPQEALHTFLTSEDTMQLYKDSLVDSELAYGTVVEVLSEKGGWSEVIVLDQPSSRNALGYPGFLRSKDLTEVAPDYIDAAEKVGVIHPSALLTFKERTRKVAFGTVLPLVETRDTDYLVLTPEGLASLEKNDAQPINKFLPAERPERMIELAQQFMDLPYVWSGTTGCGFDCSGFMYSLHRVNGVIIPRDTPEQAEGGFHVVYDEAQPGDLLLFAYEEGKGVVHHVGMYLGNDEMIHSQTPGSKVMRTIISGSKYEPELAVVARYWK